MIHYNKVKNHILFKQINFLGFVYFVYYEKKT